MSIFWIAIIYTTVYSSVHFHEDWGGSILNMGWYPFGESCSYMGRSLLIFSDVTFKMAAWWPYWICLVSGLTLVWLWISTPNLSGTILIYMGRSLLIFRDVTFKMAAWRPYWICLVSGLILVWLWISTPNFSGKILMYMGKSLLIFSDLIS